MHSPTTSDRATSRFISTICLRTRRCPRLVPALTECGWAVRAGEPRRLPVHPTRRALVGFVSRNHRSCASRDHSSAASRRSRRNSPCASSWSPTMRRGSTRSTKLFDFHRRRWGARGTAFHTTRSARLSSSTSPNALQKAGWLRLFTLHLNDELVASCMAFSFKGRFYFYQHGYDAQFQSYGLGRADSRPQHSRRHRGRAQRVRSVVRQRGLQDLPGRSDKRWLLTRSNCFRRISAAASISAPLTPSAPCARSRAGFYPPMLLRQAERWRWHVKVALASAIAGACRLEQHAHKAREQRRPLILGYHRVVEDFAVGLADRHAEHAHQPGDVRAPHRVARKEISIRRASTRSARTLDSGEPFSDPVAAITFDDGYARRV